MAKDSFIDSEKTTEINLRVPMQTNGVVQYGKIRVPMSVAEDLLQRQEVYEEDKRRMLGNNGENIDALQGGTLKG
jgi:hypothetical protein